MINYYKKVDELYIENVKLFTIETTEDGVLLTLIGGLKGRGDWPTYLEQFKEIVEEFKADIIRVDYDKPDDIWSLTILTNE